MRRLLIGLLALVGCGSVDVTPAPAPASGAPCVTSFGCVVGERCDEGACVADVGCPGSVAPRVVYEDAKDTSEPFVVSVNGREYIEAADSPEPGPSATLRFVDLATGVTSLLHHVPGYAGCYGDPLRCVVEKSPAAAALTDLTLDAKGEVWSAGMSHDLPAGYSPFFGAFSGDEAILWGHAKPDLERFEWATGQSTPLFEVGDRTPMRRVTLPSGPVVTAYTRSLTDGTSVSFAPLVPGATWTTILTTPEIVKNYWLAVPAPKGWFLVGDFLPSGTPQVWRVSPEGTQMGGSTDDPLLYAIANSYAVGDQVLDGTLARGLVCADDTCETARLDLATLARTPIGSLTLPGVVHAQVIQQRWLACDAVDATIEEPIFPPGMISGNAAGYRLRAMRILAGTAP